ncbi:zinc finger protein 271-like [Nerophis ophidion]|uniref:zinc finger protein 271-like n=1 Tax=Nerophis ophidion TaxID=159077 RepID=UPI002ADFDCB2|nr:zinc finger protein 271-like [Nerophis ophidion]
MCETTTAEYEEQLSRTKEDNELQRQLLDPFLKKHPTLHGADVHEEYQQEWSSTVEQDEPKPRHIKEEEEEHSISQEGEQLEGLEEFPLIGVIVKSEDKEAEGDQCGASQADNRLVPLSDSDDTTSHSADTDDEDSKDDMSCHTDNTHWECSQCDKTFSAKAFLIRHMRRHTGEKPFACLVCNKRFSRQDYLTRHIRTHTGEKPYSCSICNKGFHDVSALVNHTRIHTGEKPFICLVCGKSFTYKTQLTSHMKTHTGQKPFSCSICNKDFRQSSALVRHMRGHTGEKPFGCSVCGQRFSQSQSLKTHIRAHTGEKPFPCSVCGKRFTRNTNLMAHTRRHTGEKVLSCSVCDESFFYKYQVNKHKCAGENSNREPEVIRTSLRRDQSVSVHCCDCVKTCAKERLRSTRRNIPEQKKRTSNNMNWTLFSRQIKLCHTQKAHYNVRFPLEQQQTYYSRLTTGENTDYFRTHDIGEEHLHPEQQERSLRVEQKKPQPPHIKEEVEELPHIKEEEEENSISQEGKPPKGLEDVDVTKFSVIGVIVKSEDDEDDGVNEETRQEVLFAGSTTQHITEADGDHFGASQAAIVAPLSDNIDTMSHSSDTDDENSKAEMVYHTDNMPWKCFQCDKTFSNKGNLNMHMKIHSGEKTFSCSFCGKTFFQKANLTAHTRTHTGEKPYSCSVCGKRFSKNDGLKRHAGTHTREKHFLCSVCGKKFSKKDGLKRHTRIHDVEQPFFCSVCNAHFGHSSDLARHTRGHTGEKPFTCSVCGKGFYHKSHFEEHTRIHTGEKPFLCPLCGKSFSKRHGLNRHTQTHT